MKIPNKVKRGKKCINLPFKIMDNLNSLKTEEEDYAY